ncbi:MAG: hypothetical protein GF353_01855, partial [Candidatus Lokiarchaeota archaeon]|nr:hypothetical protein [Candidatus Lokiarchaeota archaeon]
MFVGRAVVEKKVRVEDVRSFDILVLSRKGLFEMNRSEWHKYTWSRENKEVASIGVKLVKDFHISKRIELLYSVYNSDDTSEKVHYEVQVEST